MANKPSSKRKTSKPMRDSSAKGGGIMSLNKSKTTPFMKFIIILIIISMVTLFLYGGFTGFVALFKNQSQNTSSTTTTDPYQALAQKYDPQINSFNTVLKSYPASATLLVSLANAHENYAFDLMQQANKTSTPTTATMDLLGKQWKLALNTYKKAAKIQKPKKDVAVDYSIAAYYSGDTTVAITLARSAVAQDAKFAPAYYNLGIFYQSAGKNDLAAQAFQQYLALDPNGQFGNKDYANQQLQALTSSTLPSGHPSVPTTTTP